MCMIWQVRDSESSWGTVKWQVQWTISVRIQEINADYLAELEELQFEVERMFSSLQSWRLMNMGQTRSPMTLDGNTTARNARRPYWNPESSPQKRNWSLSIAELNSTSLLLLCSNFDPVSLYHNLGIIRSARLVWKFGFTRVSMSFGDGRSSNNKYDDNQEEHERSPFSFLPNA